MPHLTKAAPACDADIRASFQIIPARLKTGGAAAAKVHAPRRNGWTESIVAVSKTTVAACAHDPDDLRTALTCAMPMSTTLPKHKAPPSSSSRLSHTRCFSPAACRAKRRSLKVKLGDTPKCQPAHDGPTATVVSVPQITAAAWFVKHSSHDPPGHASCRDWRNPLSRCVRATAALTCGLFDTPRADVLTNPDNAYAREAHRHGPEHLHLH
ncbi:hypothetical protein GGQ68_003406 [Sagittula marina]|uniref:Uncharacterized protein n=1 Tax=Sagittula marina TaxID=943940 RepID=A0A7W6GTR0_9RHOB|nr:hypothetical protein [Sagittula marina]MBB3987062.1 hypothetical protein [Sagittula marina]